MSYLADHSGRYSNVMQAATAPLSDESALLNGHLPPPVTLLTSKRPANLQNTDNDKESCAGVSEERSDKSETKDKGHSGYTLFGVDLTPVLPLALAVSTVIGGLCMLLVQIPMLSRFTTGRQICRMPTRSRAPESAKRARTSPKQRIRVTAATPCLALAVSTVIGGLCMLLVQIPMLSRFTTVSKVWLLAPFVVVYGLVLGCMTYCAFADPGQVQEGDTKVGGGASMDIEEASEFFGNTSPNYSNLF
eukprot:symbB.v1.2.037086.t1/scaffold5382.1/size27800/1